MMADLCFYGPGKGAVESAALVAAAAGSDPMPTNVALYYTTCDVATATVGEASVVIRCYPLLPIVTQRTRPNLRQPVGSVPSHPSSHHCPRPYPHRCPTINTHPQAIR